MMSVGQKEKRFLKELKNLFIGAQVDGDSGFINLMRIKSAYFHSISPHLMESIDEKVNVDDTFREELFDKLYTFFKRYFCESGSIYYRHLPVFSKVYDRVYDDGKDVALLWKTKMLYYVKSDVLVCSMPIELAEENHPPKRFYFDASELEHKKNNEKKSFVFTFVEVKKIKSKKTIYLKVTYSRKGTKTKAEEVLKQSRKSGIKLSEDELNKAFATFRRQTEVDFFINKDAKEFLREQFNLWVYQYMFNEETIFDEERIKQIQIIKDIAYKIIDFISQFEDELRRIWEKPKFVRNVNYVITLDKLSNKVLKKIINHKDIKAQIKEWKELEIIEGKFSIKDIFKGQTSIDDKNNINSKYRFLPIDTKYFKSLELEILDCLGNLDETLGGELVHSENWQALNTLRKRYKEKVKCIYIDPPFNLGSNGQFEYQTNYKDSCWATILENRLTLGRDFLSDDGAIFVRCDYNGNWIVRCLLDDNFGEKNHRNEISLKRTKTLKGEIKRFSTSYDTLYLYSKNQENFAFRGYRTLKPKEDWKWVDMHLPGSRKDESLLYRNFFGERLKAPKGRRWTLSQEALDDAIARGLVKMDKKGEPKFLTKYNTLGSDWTDIPSYSKDWEFITENSEYMLQRCVESVSNKKEVCLDFFSGSGTTQAVAQKLGRKWLGVEMGEHFHTVILPRMKRVFFGVQSGISKEKEVKYQGGGGEDLQILHS